MMAGGTWTSQNKVLPGVYTNFVGSGNKPSVSGNRGIVGLPIIASWLQEQALLSVTPADAIKLIAAYGDDMLLLNETMKNASQIYLYRLNKGTKAAATIGNLTVTAVYSGDRGNRYSVSVENAVGQEGKFYVITWLDTQELERQTVAKISELAANDVVKFVGSVDTLAVNAGTKLTGGADGTVTNSDYAAFLAAIETQEVNAIACPSVDADVKNLFVAFTKRMINEEGRYLQAVVSDMAADYEGVISVKNGVTLNDGTTITAAQATAYIAGATAACPLNESLTNAAYKGAVNVSERYTLAQQTDFAKTGQLVFIPSPVGNNQVIVQKDINTLTTFSAKRTYAFSKNKIIRTIFDIGTEIKNQGMNNFAGKIANNQNGRDLFKAAILAYFRSLQTNGVLRDVTADDITVSAGVLLDAIVVDYIVRPVDVIEEIYGTITVNA